MNTPPPDLVPILKLPRLDDRPGPARPLSAEAQRALVLATVARHTERRRAPTWTLAAAAASLLLVSAGVSAALLVRSRSTGKQGAVVDPLTAVPDVVAAWPEPAAPTEATAPAEIPEPEPLPRPKPAPSSSSDRLEQANRLRARGAWKLAAAAYERALAGAPRSAAGYAAMVAAGDLYTTKLGKPAKGVKLFRRALAAQPGGALAEEARWGLAEAYRRQGQRTAEARALRALLQHHPDSVRTAEARQRLEAGRARAR